jgi:hypothetical protein
VDHSSRAPKACILTVSVSAAFRREILQWRSIKKTASPWRVTHWRIKPEQAHFRKFASLIFEMTKD